MSKTPKVTKQKTIANDNEDEVDADDGIDSSMGANFADVLGMLNIPTKKGKKSLNTNKSPTVSTSSKSTSNDKANGSSNSSKNARHEYKPSPISSASTSSKPVDMVSLNLFFIFYFIFYSIFKLINVNFHVWIYRNQIYCRHRRN